MTEKQKEIIKDNLAAFEHNFGSVRIERVFMDGFNVYFPADAETYIQHCYSIDYLNGWLYGAVQAARRAEFKGR